MKTQCILFLSLLISFSLFGQLESFPESNALQRVYNNSNNSFGLSLSTQTGLTFKYDRKIIRKGNYALMGQVGFSAGITGSRYSNFHIPLSVYNKFTFGRHSLELGGGVLFSRTNFVENSTFSRKNHFNPFLHIGYVFEPKDKPWYIRTGFDWTGKRATGPIPIGGFEVGFGFKF